VTDALVVVSAVDRGRGLREGIAGRQKFCLIRSAVSLKAHESGSEETRARTKVAWGLCPATPVVGTVTRFAAPKDFSTLLAAFAQARSDRPEMHLVVAGDGPDRGEVEHAIASAGLERHVTLLGHCDDVAAVLRGFDVFAFASRREGLPRVVVEAVAAGLPVVSSDVGGVAEVLRRVPTSALVPAGDVWRMAEAIGAGFTHPVGAWSSARRAALVGFDEQDMVDAHVRLYDALLGV
jgi:glycosyltransferase involved in cell wall biosynthesis